MTIPENFVDTLEKVANLAVKKIGESKLIVALDTDTGTVADTVRTFIFQVIREVQSEFRWGELTAALTLEEPAGPADEATGLYEYALPDDFLRPASNRDQKYVIENGALFTETSENFPLRYIRYSEDPAEWSALLVKCIYFRLAMEICMPITENIQRYNGLLEEYEKVVFPRAQKVGSFDHENPVSRRAKGSYSRMRSGWMGGR